MHLFRKIFRDLQTRLPVAHPELAHILVGTGKCQPVFHQGMRKISGIEIDPVQPDLFGEFHPRRKMRGKIGVAVDFARVIAENLLLKQKLNLYRDYFPFLADLDEEIMCNPSEEFSEAEDIDQTFDRARKYLTAEEYQKLSTTDKNQLALDRYLNGKLSKVQIGRLYEMYLGWLYEKNGYVVTYNGIEQGVEDMGRDLICIKPNETVIVQAKCWSQSKTIHEKHVYQLYGTVCTYKIEHPEVKKVRAFLYVTNQLSPVARAAAQMLKIKVEENFALDKSFPMIKCNIGRSGEKIYHLPFDQQYNKTQIKSPGEMYCRTVAEAEANGFRRAKRYFSNPRASHVTP